jgi:hypothetical protein
MGDGRPILSYEAVRPTRPVPGPTWRFVIILLAVVFVLLVAFSLVA